ncbi:MAG: hypothetical protein V1874_05725 [Spirochaetota bacterium]
MRFIIIALVFLFLMGASGEIYGEYHIAPDKKLHLGAGIIIGAGSYFICPRLEELVFDRSRVHPAAWSIGMAALAGAAKEVIYDDWMGRGYRDPKDFYYTVAGGAISGLMLGIIEAVFKSKNEHVFFEANPFNKNIAVSYYHIY